MRYKGTIQNTFQEKKNFEVSAPMYILYEGTIKSTIQQTPVHTTTAARCRMSPEHNSLAEKKKRRKKFSQSVPQGILCMKVQLRVLFRIFVADPAALLELERRRGINVGDK
jgi:hypothetical protein